MFTGLVETMGEVVGMQPDGAGRRLTLRVGAFVGEPELGDSIAVNGACLTVIGKAGDDLAFQVAPETLRKTNLGSLHIGSRVNLERALRLGDRLGGHWVQGHVDGTAMLQERRPDGDWEMFWFAADPALTHHMVPKGSIALDGVCLTLVDVDSERFSMALIPHTLSVTTFGGLQPGAVVNVETDILAKYLAKWHAAGEGSMRS